MEIEARMSSASHGIMKSLSFDASNPGFVADNPIGYFNSDGPLDFSIQRGRLLLEGDLAILTDQSYRGYGEDEKLHHQAIRTLGFSEQAIRDFCLDFSDPADEAMWTFMRPIPGSNVWQSLPLRPV